MEVNPLYTSWEGISFVPMYTTEEVFMEDYSFFFFTGLAWKTRWISEQSLVPQREFALSAWHPKHFKHFVISTILFSCGSLQGSLRSP
ncbi:hypothetical protein J6590_019758 [Homalodisca vitripennis]|nr:hypothetical protein J6590_019758 [Homalodisca vitripennis]